MNHPLLNVFLMMMWFFLWIMWLFLLFRIVVDVFRSHDLNGWMKALWLVGLIILPFIGVLAYLIARGGKMGERDAQDAQKREQQFQDYVRKAAQTPSESGAAGTTGTAVNGATDPVGRLAQLADLKRNGDISQEEFDQAKAKLLV